MQAMVSAEGQIALPEPLRRQLGIRPGDAIDVEVEAGCIVLRPRRKNPYDARIISDPITGLPVLAMAEDAPMLTSEQVADMLAEFP